MDKPCHWEIPSTDLKKSTKFYSSLFGWKMQSWSDTYALFDVEGGVGGGMGFYAFLRDPCGCRIGVWSKT